MTESSDFYKYGPGGAASRKPAAPGSWAFIALTLALSIYIFKDNLDHKASLGWPTAEAVVTRSWYTCESGRAGGLLPRGCAAYAEYAFEDFTGKAGLNDDSAAVLKEERAAELVKAYPAGARITVQYDPAEPGRNRFRDAGAADWRYGAVSLAFCLVFLYLRLTGQDLGNISGPAARDAGRRGGSALRGARHKLFTALAALAAAAGLGCLLFGLVSNDLDLMLGGAAAAFSGLFFWRFK